MDWDKLADILREQGDELFGQHAILHNCPCVPVYFDKPVSEIDVLVAEIMAEPI
jgi:hypothetical protein